MEGSLSDESLVLRNARFYGHPAAESVVVREGRIEAMGSPVAGEDSMASLDLRGGFVLPGFVDAHVHLFHTGLNEIGWRIDLSGLSREEALGRLAEASTARGPGEWVIGSGWDESGWADPAYLSRTELDRVSSKAPIAAVRMDGHLLVTNSAGLQRAEDSLDPVYRDWIDAASGEIRETAVWALLDGIRPDEATLVEALSGAAAVCHREGITSVHTMSHARDMATLMARRGKDRLRIVACPPISQLPEMRAVGLQTGFGDSWLRFGGVKIFADGSIGARNAALTRPYRGGGPGDVGELNHSVDELAAMIGDADGAEWQTVIHAIGDRAIDAVLDAHEQVSSRPALRHRIEHFELARPEQIVRCRDLGVSVCMQPNFIGNWSGPGGMNERGLGADRDAASSPLRRVLDDGLPLAFGSDGMPISPLYGMASAVDSPYAGQRITVDEAIDAYTSGGARFACEETMKGSLEEGMAADFVVLDEDPATAEGGVSGCGVVMTIVGGTKVYDREDAR